MTWPRQKSPLLIAMPSRFVVPTACVLSSRSLPARSTNVSFAPASYSAPPDGAPAAARHTRTVRIACERLERPFICVSPTVRCSVPRYSTRIASSAECTASSRRWSTRTSSAVPRTRSGFHSDSLSDALLSTPGGLCRSCTCDIARRRAREPALTHRSPRRARAPSLSRRAYLLAVNLQERHEHLGHGRAALVGVGGRRRRQRAEQRLQRARDEAARLLAVDPALAAHRVRLARACLAVRNHRHVETLQERHKQLRDRGVVQRCAAPVVRARGRGRGRARHPPRTHRAASRRRRPYRT